MGRSLAVLVLALVSGGDAAWADDPPVPPELLTVAEASGFERTSRSAEVATLVDRLCARSKHLERIPVGKTVEGREMVGVRVGPPVRPEDPRLVVLLLGNIHSGECAGKAALTMLLRDIALHDDHPWLADVSLIVVPNYNADGNDRFGPNDQHRKGQIGPTEMGIRANAQKLDLNRDFVKLESPEARALVSLMTRFDPHLFVDCHTTNGSRHRYPLTYDVPHNPAAPPAVRALLRNGLIPDVTESLEADGLSTFYYGNFNKDHTQWTTYGHEPRYSTEYVGLRGRLAILSEAYSYVPFKDRVLATKAFVEACVNWVRAHPADVRRALRPSAGRLDPVPIHAEAVAFPDKVLVRGYRVPPPSGGEPRADAVSTPEDHRVDFIGDYKATKTVKRPFAYAFPATLSSVAERLAFHGIRVERLASPSRLDVEVSRIDSATKSKPFQGHELIHAVATRRTDARVLPRGSYVVRTEQALGTLAVYLLEAETDDGFITWEVFGDELKVEADFPVVRIPSRADLELEAVR